MKRAIVAGWSVAGWACVFGLKNWYLALGAFAVAVLIEVCPKR
jgi:hypothetical protein